MCVHSAIVEVRQLRLVVICRDDEWYDESKCVVTVAVRCRQWWRYQAVYLAGGHCLQLQAQVEVLVERSVFDASEMFVSRRWVCLSQTRSEAMSWRSCVSQKSSTGPGTWQKAVEAQSRIRLNRAIRQSRFTLSCLTNSYHHAGIAVENSTD